MDPCPVLVGRQQEMAELRKLLDAGGGVAVISGEAGIGKSRLVRECAAEAAQRGRVVLWGRPEEVAQPGPYALIVDLLESIVERGNADVKREGRALEHDLMQPPSNRATLSAPGPRAISAEIRGLIARTGSRPMVVLEDIHRTDEASHSVMLHLARAAKDDEHTLIASVRTEGVHLTSSLSRLMDTLGRDRIATLLSLAPLDADETSTMLQLLWGRKPQPEELANLLSLGEGIPFFIEEIALAGDTETSGVPRNIKQSMNTQLEGLGGDAAGVVRAASLLAGALDLRVLSEACGMSADSIAACLSAATKTGILIDTQGRLLFRHALVREAISSEIPSVQSMQLHSRLAKAIESVHAQALDLFAMELARHNKEAGNYDLAGQYAIRGALRAVTLAALDEARAAFQLCLELGGNRATAMRGLAEVEFREGNEEESVRLFREAANEFASTGETIEAARTMGRLAWALRNRARVAEVTAAVDQGLALLSDSKHRAYVELLVQKGQMLSFLFDKFSEARPILEQALALATPIEEDALIAEALDGLAQATDWLADKTSTLAFGERAINSAASSGSPEVIGRTHHNHAIKLASYGFPLEGLNVLATGRRHLQESFGRAGVSALDVAEAWIQWLRGRPTEVAELAAKGQAAWQRWRGYLRILEVWAALTQAQVELAESRVAAAWEGVGGKQVREALRADEGNHELRQVMYSDALLRIEMGPAEEALWATDAVVQLDRSGSSETFDRGQGLVLRAQCATKFAELSLAEASIRELRDLLDQSWSYPYLLAHAEQIEGQIAHSRGNYAEASEHLTASVELFSDCGNDSDRARSHRLLAESMLAQGDRETGVTNLRHSVELAVGAGSTAEVNLADSLLRSVGVRRRAGRPRIDRGAQTLSPRETEVAVLVAAGETNAGIARQLYLSERTVQDHISNALRRLKLNGRAALAAWAVHQGLV